MESLFGDILSSSHQWSQSLWPVAELPAFSTLLIRFNRSQKLSFLHGTITHIEIHSLHYVVALYKLILVPGHKIKFYKIETQDQNYFKLSFSQNRKSILRLFMLRSPLLIFFIHFQLNCTTLGNCRFDDKAGLVYYVGPIQVDEIPMAATMMNATPFDSSEYRKVRNIVSLIISTKHYLF